MNAIHHSLQQGQIQHQELQLSPQQYQALELLNAPLLELQERIDQELNANPVLEIETHPLEVLSGDPVGGVTAAELQPEAEERIDRDDGFAELAELAEGWSDSLPAPAGDDPDAERRHDHRFQSLTGDTPEIEPLVEQLRWLEAPEAVLAAARHIIEMLDERGYLTTDPGQLAEATGANVADYEAAWRLVRSLEPAGIGARDLADCLTLQLERRGDGDDMLYELVQHHLDDLARNRLPQVAKALQLTMPELQEYLGRLRGLKTAPAEQLNARDPGFAVPELEVKRAGDGWAVEGHDRWLPRLRINPEYLEMVQDPATPLETRNYLRDKIVKAQELFHNLQFRQSTLRRIAEALTVLQPDFFQYGPERLKPLTMRQMADRLGIHETTVSRAVSGKYLQTPFGLTEFRKFFSGGYTNTTGEEVAASAIHKIIRQLVDAENPAKPLSDDTIARELEQRGFQVARRTIAKYRTILGILPTNLRRRHTR